MNEGAAQRMQSERNLTRSADRAAIGLSLLCVVHCMLVPVAIALIPTVTLFGLEDEWFHRVLLVVVLPLSVFALSSGLRRHNSKSVLAIGLVGLTLLIVAALAGHDLVGETGERLLTLLGSFLVAVSHLRNFRLCQIAPYALPE
jgi:dUTPase